jgi:beta-glucanase (GH16 family)
MHRFSDWSARVETPSMATRRGALALCLCALLVCGCGLPAATVARRAAPHHRRTGHSHRVRPHQRRVERRGEAQPVSGPSTIPPAVSGTLAPSAGSPTAEPVAAAPPAERRLLFDDEFDGPRGSSPDASRWSFDTGGGGWGNQELETYTARPANAALDGEGQLAITARRESFEGADHINREYTSARLQTLETFQFQYGRAEARIEVPAGDGLVGQFWALGGEAYESETAWPGCGEIDTMEVLGSEPDTVNGTLHGPWPWAPNGIGASTTSPVSLAAGYHVYSVEWGPDQISFALDGVTYQTVAREDLPTGSPWPFGHPFFLLMDLAVGGEWPGSPDPSTPFPARMLVDWVRVWQ